MVSSSVCAGQRWWSGAGSNRRPSAFQVNRAKRCADLGKRTSMTSRITLGGRCGIDVSRAQYTPSTRQDIDPTEYHRDHRWRYCSRFRPARGGSP